MQENFGIYIHWPFCLSKCPYCDFFSKPQHTWSDSLFQKAYFRDLNALVRRPVTSVFFGGGTPSLMSVSLVEAILKKIENDFGFDSHVEISMEANPDAMTLDKMKNLKSLGINRWSLGIQALDEQALRFLGRRHSLSRAIESIEQAQSIFDNVSIDLIYTRPSQTLAAWDKELSQALSFGTQHLSLYQLTIEEGTVFYKKGIELPDEEISREMFLWTLDRMEQAHRPMYEVSNFAQSGFECRHNLLYWQGDDYAGIGPAAHGRLGLKATAFEKSVEKWLLGKKEEILLTHQERFEEKVMMGLRLKKGLIKKGLEPDYIRQAVSRGWILEDDEKIYPTQEGFLMLNQLTYLLLGA